MFMFLPFVVALLTVVTAMTGRRKMSYFFWGALFIITILTFKHHAYIDIRSFFHNNGK